jgi:hypothetical protein
MPQKMRPVNGTRNISGGAQAGDRGLTQSDVVSGDVEDRTTDDRHYVGWGSVSSIEQPIGRVAAYQINGVHGVVDLHSPRKRNLIGFANDFGGYKNSAGDGVEAVIRDHKQLAADALGSDPQDGCRPR